MFGAGEWTCTRCTLKNPGSLMNCGVCDAPRPGSSGAAKWTCRMCTFINETTDAVCTMCTTPNPNPSAVAKGPVWEWNDNGTWTAYDAPTTVDLEQAYNSGKRSVDLNKYRVDTNLMLQYNL